MVTQCKTPVDIVDLAMYSPSGVYSHVKNVNKYMNRQEKQFSNKHNFKIRFVYLIIYVYYLNLKYVASLLVILCRNKKKEKEGLHKPNF